MASSKSNINATVAIFGGTGDIGLNISRVFLTEYRSVFPNVRITTRDVNSAKSKELAKLGAELHPFSDSIDTVLSGVDVVINALPTSIPAEYADKLTEAVARHNVKVYFLSEFGIDYRFNDFPGYEHVEWTYKRGITAKTRALTKGKNTKVIALVTGMFQGWLSSPGLGIDIENNVYTPLGPGSVRFSTTAEKDIARSVAQLAILALDPANASRVPDDLRVQGHTVSFEELREIVARVKGVPRGELKSEDLSTFKNALRENPSGNVLPFIRIAIGEGKLDFSSENANELVNPGESLWKWQTIDVQLSGTEAA